MCEGYFIAVAEETLEQKLLVKHCGQSNMEVCGGVLTDALGCPSQSSFVIVAFCILILELVLGFFCCCCCVGLVFFLFMQDLFLTASVLVLSILILAVFSSLGSPFLGFSCRCLVQGDGLCALQQSW